MIKYEQYKCDSINELATTVVKVNAIIAYLKKKLRERKEEMYDKLWRNFIYKWRTMTKNFCQKKKRYNVSNLKYLVVRSIIALLIFV